MPKYKVVLPENTEQLLVKIGEVVDRGPVFEGLVSEDELRMIKMEVDRKPQIAEIEEFGKDPEGSEKMMVRVVVFTDDPSNFWKNILLRCAINTYCVIE